MPLPLLDNRLALRQRPNRSPVMYQKWRDLLFLHWEVDPTDIQKTLPPGLYVDTFADKAYLGIVPFFMRDIRPRFCPTVPGISNFLEVNVRTYVYNDQGVAGVWFYSLDANQWLAVKLARLFFKLPYFYAKIHALEDSTGAVDYHTRRRGYKPDTASHFHYRQTGPLHQADPGTLEFFLIERYVLFAVPGNGRLAQGQVYHPPYQIGGAEVSHWDANLLRLDGLPYPDRHPDHMLYSPGVEVDVFGLT